MFAQKKTSTDIRFLDALVPRGLIASARDVLYSSVSRDGLCPLRFFLKNGSIQNIEVLESSKANNLSILLPRLVEPHAHIDKAFTWKAFPNLSGTYEEALKLNLEEHKYRTKEKVRCRAEKSLNFALKNGVRAIRSHVDSFDETGNVTWDALCEIKDEWQSWIDLQLVALVPLEYWLTPKGTKFAHQISNQGGILGGVVCPPYQREKLHEILLYFLALSNDLGCPIDLHIDESSQQPGAGLRELLKVLDQIKVDIPITCSHLSSMGMIPSKNLKVFAERLAHHDVNVVALPLTNFWLLSRNQKITPFKRPIAPISQLQQAGVTVAVGGDNVQDPWYPGGNFDPIALMTASMTMTQLSPWNRLGLTAFTTSPARVLRLEWDGTLQIGSPADFLLLEVGSWSDAMSKLPKRKVMIKGNWV